MNFKKIDQYYYESDLGYRVVKTTTKKNKYVVFKRNIEKKYKPYEMISDLLSLEQAIKMAETHWFLNHDDTGMIKTNENDSKLSET